MHTWLWEVAKQSVYSCCFTVGNSVVKVHRATRLKGKMKNVRERKNRGGSARTPWSTGLPTALCVLTPRQPIRGSWGAVWPSHCSVPVWQACTSAVSACVLTFRPYERHYFHFYLPNLVQVSPVANSNPGPREEGILGNRVLTLLSHHTRNHNSLSTVNLAILWKNARSLCFSKPDLNCK